MAQYFDKIAKSRQSASMQSLAVAVADASQRGHMADVQLHLCLELFIGTAEEGLRGKRKEK